MFSGFFFNEYLIFKDKNDIFTKKVQRKRIIYMSDLRPEDFDDVPDDEMTVTITTDDGDVTCSVLTILTVDGKDYIALLPLDEEENPTEDVWFYGYSENPDDPNEEPVLSMIESDEEFEAVEDKFDEYLDNLDFDEM